MATSSSSLECKIPTPNGKSFLLHNLLKCPLCGSDFSLHPDILCAQGHSFPHRENVIDFSSVDKIDHLQTRSKQSFGIEWTQYYADLGWASKELSGETQMFLTYTRAMPNFFSDSIVVDAGCGNGRYINVINNISSPPPRLVIGIDLADSVFVAAKNCSNFSNVVFLKMNLSLLPKILKEPVDYIYSIGVLHHTPNAKESFDNLVRCVKKEGFMSLYLYGKGNSLLYRVNSFLRNRFFQAWPHKLVYYLAVLIAIPCQLFRVPFFGPWMLDFITRFVFISYDVHNMFDAYTAGYTSFHEKREVEEWYRSNGFDCVVESQLNHTSLYCIGRRI
jgi:SAM-dependent methyltransferase